MFWRKNDGICILIIHSYVKYCLICVTKKYEYGQYIFYINMKKNIFVFICYCLLAGCGEAIQSQFYAAHLPASVQKQQMPCAQIDVEVDRCLNGYYNNIKITDEKFEGKNLSFLDLENGEKLYYAEYYCEWASAFTCCKKSLGFNVTVNAQGMTQNSIGEKVVDCWLCSKWE